MQTAIYLNENDHVNHPIVILHTGKDEIEDQGDHYLLPEGATLVRVTCQICDCILLEGEDFQTEEVEPWLREPRDS